MSTPVARAVLRDTVTRDDIDDAMAACRFQLTNVLPPSPQQPAQLIYAIEQTGEFLYLVSDGRLDVHYFAVGGEANKATLTRLRERLDCYQPGAHRELFALGDPASIKRGLALQALTVQPLEGEDIAAIEAASTHADVTVRRAALIASTYAPCPALRSLLEAVHQGDPDATLRSDAAAILAALFREEP